MGLTMFRNLFMKSLVLSLVFAPIAFAETFRSERLSDGRRIIVTESNELIPESDLVARCHSEAECLRTAGWRFHAPRPKSAQAAWGNHDRRTTWFYGYWTDGKRVSDSIPHIRRFGSKALVVGDGIDNRGYYRNGGSPAPLTQIQRELCANCQ